MVTVKVNFYGVVKGIVGTPSLEVSMPQPFTLRQLLARLAERCGPGFSQGVLCDQRGIRPHVRLFINKQMVDSQDMDKELSGEEEHHEATVMVLPDSEGG